MNKSWKKEREVSVNSSTAYRDSVFRSEHTTGPLPFPTLSISRIFVSIQRTTTNWQDGERAPANVHVSNILTQRRIYIHAKHTHVNTPERPRLYRKGILPSFLSRTSVCCGPVSFWMQARARHGQVREGECTRVSYFSPPREKKKEKNPNPGGSGARERKERGVFRQNSFFRKTVGSLCFLDHCAFVRCTLSLDGSREQREIPGVSFATPARTVASSRVACVNCIVHGARLIVERDTLRGKPVEKPWTSE